MPDPFAPTDPDVLAVLPPPAAPVAAPPLVVPLADDPPEAPEAPLVEEPLVEEPPVEALLPDPPLGDVLPPERALLPEPALDPEPVADPLPVVIDAFISMNCPPPLWFVALPERLSPDWPLPDWRLPLVPTAPDPDCTQPVSVMVLLSPPRFC